MSTGLQGWVDDLAARWRKRAGLLGGYGAVEASETLERAAEELESSFRAWWLAELTISEGAAEAGYSAERLRELVAGGQMPGKRDGAAGLLRVRRCDLPRKPAPPPPPPPLQAVAVRLGIK